MPIPTASSRRRNCCSSWSKLAILFYNIILFVSSVLLIRIGWLAATTWQQDYALFLPAQALTVLSVSLAVIGCVTSVITAANTFAILCNSAPVTAIMSVMLGLSFLLTLTSALFQYELLNSDMESELKTSMTSSIKNDPTGQDMAVWDTLQTERQCCGARSALDWVTEDRLPKEQTNSSTVIPLSCCPPRQDSTNATDDSPHHGCDALAKQDSPYMENMRPGCATVLAKTIRQQGASDARTTVTAAMLQLTCCLLGLVVSVSLYRRKGVVSLKNGAWVYVGELTSHAQEQRPRAPAPKNSPGVPYTQFDERDVDDDDIIEWSRPTISNNTTPF